MLRMIRRRIVSLSNHEVEPSKLGRREVNPSPFFILSKYQNKEMKLYGLKPVASWSEILSGHFSSLPSRARFSGRECIKK